MVAANVRHRARQDERATQLYRSVAESPASTIEAARGMFSLGALAERAGGAGEAIDWYLRAAVLAPDGPLKAEPHWPHWPH